jgi:catechol 2,3-dioxygenase-like lactoylglutathione lyase family enzyme
VEPRISLITLGVDDLDRSRAFYVQLGFPLASGPGSDVAFFQAGPMVLALWDRRRLAEDSGVEDAGRSGGFALAHNVRSPAEVDAVTEEVRRAGGTITREPGETFWGGYSSAFADLDGHPWEIAHNPHWTIREDGSVSLHAPQDR